MKTIPSIKEKLERRGLPVTLQSVRDNLSDIAMDFWASLEHDLRYKNDAEFTEELSQELVQCAQLSADLDNRMDRLRKSVQPTTTESGVSNEV